MGQQQGQKPGQPAVEKDKPGHQQGGGRESGQQSQQPGKPGQPGQQDQQRGGQHGQRDDKR